MPRLLRAAAATTLLAGLIVPGAVFAHHINPRHSAGIVVREVADGWEVGAVLLLELPPDARSRQLIAQFDLNRSGTIEAAEGRLLADALGPEAVGGFAFLADGSAPIPESVEGTATSDGEGRIRVGIILSYRLPHSTERIGAKVLERPGGGRVEARPVYLTMELRDGDESRTILPTVVKRPGEDASEIVLRRETEPAEGGAEEGEKPEQASPATETEPAAPTRAPAI